MMPRRIIFLSLALALMLTGCFRQASEPFESADGLQSDTPQDVQTPLPLASATPEQEEPTLDIVPTDEMIATDIATDVIPTIEVLATETPETSDNTSQTAATQDTLPTLGGPITSTPMVVQPTNTNPPAPTNTQVQQATSSSQGNVNSGPTLTPTFITPGVPTGSGNPSVNTTPLAPNATPVTATPSGLVTPTDVLNPNNVPEQCLYTVQSGDNLFRIAINNGLSLDQVRSANPQIRSDVIQPGDQIILPVAGCEGETGSTTPPQATSPSTGSGDQIIHTVQSGETLGQIARRYGTTIAAITQANSLADPNRLSIGQQLIIPQE